MKSYKACILTANAILPRESLSAIATVEQDAEAVMIPADIFRAWVPQYDLWCDFVFDLLSQRISSVMEIVDEVAFRRKDIRVATLLVERNQKCNPIIMAHQEIAAESGSSREAISRILENLVSQGIIRILRGSIDVLESVVLASQSLRNFVTDRDGHISYTCSTNRIIRGDLQMNAFVNFMAFPTGALLVSWRELF